MLRRHGSHETKSFENDGAVLRVSGQVLTILERRIDVRGGHEETQVDAIRALSGREDLEVLTSTAAPAGHTTKANSPYPLHRCLAPSAHKAEAGDEMLKADIPQLSAFFAARTRPRSLLVPTATSYDIRLILGALEHGEMPGTIALRLLEERHVTALSPVARESLHQYVANGRLMLVTETASLTDHLRAKHGLLSRPDLVLPCSLMPDSRAAVNRMQGRFQVGFLGNARREKGWHDLPDIIGALSTLAARDPMPRKIEFIVPRARKSVLKPSNLSRSARLHIKARAGGVFRRDVIVKRSAKFMPDDEFIAHLQSLDLVVLPYRPANYAHRGSGVILDAVLAQKPLVYSDGIGMGEYLRFGNAIAAQSATEFAEGIRKILGDPDACRDGCAAANDFAQKQFTIAADFLRTL